MAMIRYSIGAVDAVDKHMTGAETEEKKSHSRDGSWRTRMGVCCVGKSGVEGGMGEYMRLSGGWP